MQTKTILVAPLNWGLGHATRCIPIIRKLIEHNFNVLIGSDGAALLLLTKEFPQLPSIELPSYNITYPKKATSFKWSLVLKLPHFQKTIKLEIEIIEQLISENKIVGILSDNRFGVRSSKVPSIYLTHQLNVFSGSTTWLSTLMHQHIIRKFDVCWVPDIKEYPNLSGKLGHIKSNNPTAVYIGPLSRMNKQNLPITYDILVLLSGPEPQRTFLETKIINEIKGTTKNILLIQGIVEAQQKSKQLNTIKIINFMNSAQLEKAINESEIVISRPGYTTIMDLAVLEKKAFFIPTPGQYEQEYLATTLKKSMYVPFCEQDDFTVDKLIEIDTYKGLPKLNYDQDFKTLFSSFESKRKL